MSKTKEELKKMVDNAKIWPERIAAYKVKGKQLEAEWNDSFDRHLAVVNMKPRLCDVYNEEFEKDALLAFAAQQLGEVCAESVSAAGKDLLNLARKLGVVNETVARAYLDVYLETLAEIGKACHETISIANR